MISTIIVTYNSMNVLADCFTSLERSTVASEIELILVDNASTDGTSQLLQAYLARAGDLPYAAIRVLTLTDNRGYAYANNRGLEMARGETLLLLNPDTIVGQDTIQRCTESLYHQPGTGAVGCRLELPNGKLDRACRRSFPTLWNSATRFSGLSLLFPSSKWLARYNLTFLDEHGSYFVDTLCGAFIMVPRSVYDHVGGLDEAFFMYGEDIDWCYRIKHGGYDVWYNGAVTTVHFKGGNGGKRSRQSLHYFYDTMHVYYTKTLGHDGRSVRARIILVLLRFLFYLHVTVKQIP
jgi:N-acetylglucosaminyl-diphospho-decaprenol L-rhamnosyltransferase